MRNFIMNNWVSLLIALAAGTYTLILVFNKQWDTLKQKAYNLMELAEKTITGSKKGQERMAAVLDEVYTLLPGWLKIFVSRQRMQEILQDWFNDIKDYLNNNSNQEQKPPDTILK